MLQSRHPKREGRTQPCSHVRCFTFFAPWPTRVEGVSRKDWAVVNTDLGATNKYQPVDKFTNNENPEVLTPQTIKMDCRLNTREGS